VRNVVLLVAGQKDDLLAGSGFGALAGPSQLVCAPAYLATAALASDTASAKAGWATSIAASAAAGASKACWLTSTFMVLSSLFEFAPWRRTGFIS
jgi:hypothetical protein